MLNVGGAQYGGCTSWESPPQVEETDAARETKKSENERQRPMQTSCALTLSLSHYVFMVRCCWTAGIAVKEESPRATRFFLAVSFSLSLRLWHATAHTC